MKAITPFMYVVEVGHWKDLILHWNIHGWCTNDEEDDVFLVQTMVELLSQFQPVQHAKMRLFGLQMLKMD